MKEEQTLKPLRNKKVLVSVTEDLFNELREYADRLKIPTSTLGNNLIEKSVSELKKVGYDRYISSSD